MSTYVQYPKRETTPRVLVAYHHRYMCVGMFFRMAFQQAGCQVISAGPFSPEVYNRDGWSATIEPNIHLQNKPIMWSEFLESVPGVDLVVMVDQYDPFYIDANDRAGGPKLAWIAVENFNDVQANRVEDAAIDRHYHMIHHRKGNHQELIPGSTWLPFGCDPFLHPYLGSPKTMTVAQIGSPYPPRPEVWNALRKVCDGAPALTSNDYLARVHLSPTTAFGQGATWRQSAQIYNSACIALSASNCDFAPMRVWEAPAQGALFCSDDWPAIRKLMGPPFDFSRPSDGFSNGIWFAHDATTEGTVETVRRIMDLDEKVLNAVATNAYAAAMSAHTYAHRARQILHDVGLQGIGRMVSDV